MDCILKVLAAVRNEMCTLLLQNVTLPILKYIYLFFEQSLEAIETYVLSHMKKVGSY